MNPRSDRSSVPESSCAVSSRLGVRGVAFAARVAWFLACTCCVLLPSRGVAQRLDRDLWMANGDVVSMLKYGNTLYLGGYFSHVGPYTGSGVPIAYDMYALPGPQVRGTVRAVVDDQQGGWFIGGDFDSVGGVYRPHLAHVLSDFSVSAWNPAPDGPVRALAVVNVGRLDQWSDMASGSAATLRGVRVVPGALYAVGSGGTILRASGGWSTMTSGTTNDLNGIWGLQSSSLFAVGAVGTIRHYNGTSWGGMTSGTTADLNAVWGTSATNVFAVGVGGAVRHYDGSTWTRVLSGTTHTLSGIWGTSATDAYVVGTSGTILHYDGTGLSGMTSGTTDNLFGVWGSSASNVYVVGADGTILRYDGSNWTAMSSGTTTTLFSVWGSSSSDVYAVGANGLVLHYDGTAWSTMASGTASALYGIWGNSTLNYYVVGASGVALHPYAAVYAGGDFSSIGGQLRSRIAALNPSTGLATGWDPAANSRVRAIAIDGGAVYAGGAFTSIGGQTRWAVAALDPATGLATSWAPAECCQVYEVYALLASGNTVYIGGSFAYMGGQLRQNLAAVDAVTGLATGFVANTLHDGLPVFVYALAKDGSILYVGGDFTATGGASRSGLAALNATTGTATAWNPNPTGEAPYLFVNALAVNGTTVYAGGRFDHIGGQPRLNLAVLDATTGLATWDTNANHDVLALAASATIVYAGGAFTSVGGARRARLAALDLSTGRAAPWDPSVRGACVNALAFRSDPPHGSTVYAGGDFYTVGGQARTNIAAIDATTGIPAAWASWVAGTVDALAVSGSTVYVGGAFTHVVSAAYPRSNIAAIDAGTGVPTSWNPNAAGTSAVVHALAVSGTTVYAGGHFSSIGGQTRTGIAALDGTTGAATAWDPNATGAAPDVYALTVNGPTVYAGGDFTGIGGQPRNRIAALDVTLDTNNATGWNPTADGRVNALTVHGPLVYAGGAFTSVGGQLRNQVAALEASTGLATPWDPDMSGAADAIVPFGFTVYVGGSFSQLGGVPVECVAALDDPTLVGVESEAPRPLSFALLGANPFVDHAQFRFVLPASAHVLLTVHDVTGRRVAGLVDAEVGPGEHTLTWSARSGRLSAGVYFARFVAGGQALTSKLVLLR